MISKFESLFTTKKIVRAKYPKGWVGWLNDQMSDEDDTHLTRFTTMDGFQMFKIIKKLNKYGFEPPKLIHGKFYFKDYYLDGYEFYQYFNNNFSKYICKPPDWLEIKPQPEMSLKIIDLNKLNVEHYNGLEYSHINY